MECGICYEELIPLYHKICCNVPLCINCRINLRKQDCPFCRSTLIAPFEEEGKLSRRIMLFTRTERKRIRRIQKLDLRERNNEHNRKHNHNKYGYKHIISSDY